LTKVQLAKAADVLLLAIQHGAGLFNEDTQWTLKVNRKDRGKMGDNAGQTAEESKAVAGIDSLVRNAVVAERHADTQHKNPDVQAILRMYAPVSIGGTLYRAKLTVQDYKGGDKRHLHALSAVEIENAPLGTLLPYSGAEALQAAQPTTVRRLSIAKLMREASMETGVKFTASP
jgi:Large polyvalent protein-associated domain 3